MIDTNAVIQAYLKADVGIHALVADRIYCPRLIENAVLPAIGFFTRGGSRANPHIPPLLSPSKQFDCWAKTEEVAGVEIKGSITARAVYRALYDALQGIQNVKVTIGATDFYILSAIEEVQGQDLVDVDIQGYFRVLTFFEIIVR